MFFLRIEYQRYILKHLQTHLYFVMQITSTLTVSKPVLALSLKLWTCAAIKSKTVPKQLSLPLFTPMRKYNNCVSIWIEFVVFLFLHILLYRLQIHIHNGGKTEA